MSQTNVPNAPKPENLLTKIKKTVIEHKTATTTTALLSVGATFAFMMNAPSSSDNTGKESESQDSTHIETRHEKTTTEISITQEEATQATEETIEAEPISNDTTTPNQNVPPPKQNETLNQNPEPKPNKPEEGEPPVQPLTSTTNPHGLHQPQKQPTPPSSPKTAEAKTAEAKTANEIPPPPPIEKVQEFERQQAQERRQRREKEKSLKDLFKQVKKADAENKEKERQNQIKEIQDRKAAAKARKIARERHQAFKNAFGENFGIKGLDLDKGGSGDTTPAVDDKFNELNKKFHQFQEKQQKKQAKAAYEKENAEFLEAFDKLDPMATPTKTRSGRGRGTGMLAVPRADERAPIENTQPIYYIFRPSVPTDTTAEGLSDIPDTAPVDIMSDAINKQKAKIETKNRNLATLETLTNKTFDEVQKQDMQGKQDRLKPFDITKEQEQLPNLYALATQDLKDWNPKEMEAIQKISQETLNETEETNKLDTLLQEFDKKYGEQDPNSFTKSKAMCNWFYKDLNQNTKDLVAAVKDTKEALDDALDGKDYKTLDDSLKNVMTVWKKINPGVGSPDKPTQRWPEECKVYPQTLYQDLIALRKQLMRYILSRPTKDLRDLKIQRANYMLKTQNQVLAKLALKDKIAIDEHQLDDLNKRSTDFAEYYQQALKMTKLPDKGKAYDFERLDDYTNPFIFGHHSDLTGWIGENIKSKRLTTNLPNDYGYYFQCKYLKEVADLLQDNELKEDFKNGFLELVHTYNNETLDTLSVIYRGVYRRTIDPMELLVAITQYAFTNEVFDYYHYQTHPFAFHVVEKFNRGPKSVIATTTNIKKIHHLLRVKLEHLKKQNEKQKLMDKPTDLTKAWIPFMLTHINEPNTGFILNNGDFLGDEYTSKTSVHNVITIPLFRNIITSLASDKKNGAMYRFFQPDARSKKFLERCKSIMVNEETLNAMRENTTHKDIQEAYIKALCVYAVNRILVQSTQDGSIGKWVHDYVHELDYNKDIGGEKKTWDIETQYARFKTDGWINATHVLDRIFSGAGKNWIQLPEPKAMPPCYPNLLPMLQNTDIFPSYAKNVTNDTQHHRTEFAQLTEEDVNALRVYMYIRSGRNYGKPANKAYCEGHKEWDIKSLDQIPFYKIERWFISDTALQHCAKMMLSDNLLTQKEHDDFIKYVPNHRQNLSAWDFVRHSALKVRNATPNECQKDVDGFFDKTLRCVISYENSLGAAADKNPIITRAFKYHCQNPLAFICYTFDLKDIFENVMEQLDEQYQLQLKEPIEYILQRLGIHPNEVWVNDHGWDNLKVDDIKFIFQQLITIGKTASFFDKIAEIRAVICSHDLNPGANENKNENASWDITTDARYKLLSESAKMIVSNCQLLYELRDRMMYEDYTHIKNHPKININKNTYKKWLNTMELLDKFQDNAVVKQGVIDAMENTYRNYTDALKALKSEYGNEIYSTNYYYKYNGVNRACVLMCEYWVEQYKDYLDEGLFANKVHADEAPTCKTLIEEIEKYYKALDDKTSKTNVAWFYSLDYAKQEKEKAEQEKRRNQNYW